jgi:hypothetical protein
MVALKKPPTLLPAAWSNKSWSHRSALSGYLNARSLPFLTKPPIQFVILYITTSYDQHDPVNCTRSCADLFRH